MMTIKYAKIEGPPIIPTNKVFLGACSHFLPSSLFNPEIKEKGRVTNI